MQGIVSDIQRFSLVDGPGIRTTVFLQGCNLACAWCHNPETISPLPCLSYHPERCIGCLHCLGACPSGAHRESAGGHIFERENCVSCGACAAVCFAGALEMSSRSTSVDEVMGEILQDSMYYEESGGGVTISGGEPGIQPEFVRELLSECRAARIGTAIESNLAAPWPAYASFVDLVDLAMVDVKLGDREAHERWTGLGNGRILENLDRLSKLSLPVIARTPIIPGVNDRPEEIGAICDLIEGMPNLLQYELLEYNPLGESKYEALGRCYGLRSIRPSGKQALEGLARVAQARGIKTVIA